jgi:hypothetical protein
MFFNYIFNLFFIYCFVYDNKKNPYKNDLINENSIKSKIEKEIDLINIISIIEKKKHKFLCGGGYIIRLLNSKKHDNIFALLTENERLFFTLILRTSKKFLEFGMGGSTLLAFKTLSIKKIVSVEHNFGWFKKISNFDGINNQIGKRIFLDFINLGKLKKNYPLKENINNFSIYSNQIFQKYENDYDFVFIDGIFRVACALQTILNCQNDVKIMIHDMNYYLKYHILYKYLEVIYSIDTMVLFCIKKNINIEEVKKDYEIYKNKPEY